MLNNIKDVSELIEYLVTNPDPDPEYQLRTELARDEGQLVTYVTREQYHDILMILYVNHRGQFPDDNGAIGFHTSRGFVTLYCKDY